MKIKITLFLLCGWLGAAAQESPLTNIEQRLEQAIYASFAKQSNEMLPIITQLELVKNEPMVTYWSAYGYYYAAVYTFKMQQKDAAIGYLEKGAKLLDDQSKPNSEDYALLGAITSLTISLKPNEAITLSTKATNYYEKSKKLNDQNLRAYLGIGRSDFYKPKEYGGGKIAEANLLKAIALPATTSKDPHAPTWGRSEAYQMLVSFYEREGRLDEAKLYCAKGLKAFPENSELARMSKKLSGQ